MEGDITNQDTRFGGEDELDSCEGPIKLFAFPVGRRKYIWSLEEKLKSKVLI